jgi:multiple sugar transport system substrate-binding protein
MAAQFDRSALDRATTLDATTGRRGLHALPMAYSSRHVHIWRNLLERAGFTLADIPKEWKPFWDFWCDKVQPAVRNATGREDIYGVGLDMAPVPGNDTEGEFFQFVYAYKADYVTRDGRLVIDEPRVRAGLIKAIDDLAGIQRKGCNPPDAVDWDNYGNNKAFLEQKAVMTFNNSLSIPNALKDVRPDDYYKNVVTIEWPNDAYGQPLTLWANVHEAAVFKSGEHAATAKEFVHFLVSEGWLAHWLNFTADRWVPPIPALLDQPFWLDPGDPHRMAVVMQFRTHPRDYDYATVSGEVRHRRVDAEGVWPKAVYRVAAEGVAAEQAVDEAIVRIKQLLSE